MPKIVIGKSGERQTGPYSSEREYAVAQIATDDDGNWWFSLKKENIGNALPADFNGVGTQNEWWVCVFDAVSYKTALAQYAQSIIDSKTQQAQEAVSAANKALSTAQEALRTTEDVQEAIDAANAAADHANASVSIADPATADAMWEDFDIGLT